MGYTIYKATHKDTGKFYIGRTSKKLEERMGQHWADSKRNTKFYSFLKNTTMDEWKWEILDVVDTVEDSRTCEMYHIRLLGAYENGLNSRTGNGADNMERARAAASIRFKEFRAVNPDPWHKGKTGVYSQETLDKMSLAKLKNPTRRSWSEAQKLECLMTRNGRKQIMEVGTNIVYLSINDAAKKTGLKRESIRDVVNGRRSHVAGRVFVLAPI